MAMRVPQYEQRQVVQARQPVGVAAAQSGMGQIAKGLSDVGQMFDQWQADVDEADAKAADTTYSDRVRKSLYEDGTGYLYAQGGDALSRRKQAAEALQKDYDEILNGLSPRAREMAQASLESRRQSALTSVDRHAGGERITYLNGQADARVKSAIDDAIIDPAHIDRSLAIARNEVAETGARNGWSPEQTAAKAAEAEGAIHGGIVTRLANVDPQQALDYLNAHRDKMPAGDVARLEGALLPEAKRARGRQMGEAALSDGPDALSVIRRFEGYQDTPYWDVNAHRVGYGSDTITRSDGVVVKVQPGMQVSRDDAERDLRRRVSTEFLPAARAGVGPEIFDKLSQAQQAVMVSLTYNYGTGAWAKGLAGVSQALATGNPAAVVDAIRGLGSHNGGVNRKRRNEEAAIFQAGMGGFVAPAWSGVAAERRATGMEALLDIEDPDVRAAAMDEYNLRLGVQVAQQKAAQDAAQQAAFALIESGGDVDGLTLDQKLQIGQSGMSSLRTYQGALRKQEPIQTDPELFVSLSQQAATDPMSFAAENPLEWRNRLSDADFKDFVGKQAAILKGDKPSKPEAPTTVSTINTVSSDLLKAAGIDDKKPAGAKRIVQFQSDLLRWAAQAQAENGGKAPTQAEIFQKAQTMLAPVVIDPPGMWNERTGAAFDLDLEGFTPADIRDGTLTIGGTAVDPAVLEAFVREFSAALGRAPTPQEVIEGLVSAP